jgi:hypothetical protein
VTKIGYRLLLVFFAAIALAGAFAAGPSHDEIGPTATTMSTPTTMSCDEWMRAPRAMDHVRLENCRVNLLDVLYDFADPSGGSGQLRWVSARVYPRDPMIRFRSRTRFTWYTDDPQVRSIVYRVARCDRDAACLARLRARRDPRFQVTRTMQGEMIRVPPDDDHPEDGPGSSSTSARNNASLQCGDRWYRASVLAIVALLIVVRVQRKWTARREVSATGARRACSDSGSSTNAYCARSARPRASCSPARTAGRCT